MSTSPSAPEGTGQSAPALPGKRPPIPREIRVLIAAAFVIAIGFGLIAPILPQFATSFNVGVAAASVIVSIFAFTRLLFAPVSGKLTEKLGEPTVYVTGVMTVAASTILCGFAQDYAQLLLFRGLGGLGSTMFTVSAMALIARLSPPEIRGRIAGFYAGAFLLGNVAGPVLGSLMIGLGYRIPFFIYGGALVVASAIVFFSLAASKSSRLANEASRVAHNKAAAVSLAEAFSFTTFRAALVSGFANGWMAFGIRMSLIPLFAVAAFKDGAELAGLALAIFAVGNGAALTISGRFTDKHGRRLPVMLGLIVASVATALLGWADNVPLFIALSVIAGAGTGFMGPAQQAAIADIVGQGRNGGKVLASFQMATDFGSIIGPLLAGMIADRAGFGWAFTVSGVIGIIGVIAWLPVREKRGPAVS
ncbi:MFS transporter [Paeniglutamicibacter cryotolerans]|uniref:MFS family permease n=1 Tax=Paeniglutamicibacter cryotolerans TaxID=670079 RepID=A0A839QZK1_9MICC|nr:MFS transporter [Paeniglutamicibacter cryotolerans]MBB2997401.1 MFS family permease [Paeniglutamicibacter cryotolerans]